jgi:hypothetical protein
MRSAYFSSLASVIVLTNRGARRTNKHKGESEMVRQNEVATAGRFNMAPSAVIVRQITTGDVASGAVAAARRFEARERELRSRFEAELHHATLVHAGGIPGMNEHQ